MASLAERLNGSLAAGGYAIGARVTNNDFDIQKAIAVCAAVQAFQAAEQERKAAWADKSKPEWDAKRAALSSINVAKSRARLLEVNLE
jgi:hypothetical protein